MAVVMWSTPGSSFISTGAMNRGRLSSDSQMLMVMNPPADLFLQKFMNQPQSERKNRIKGKYKRKRIPETEKEAKQLRKQREKEYEQLVSKTKNGSPSIWSFDCLFPEPILDKDTIDRDLYEVKRRDAPKNKNSVKKGAMRTASTNPKQQRPAQKMRSSFYGGTSMLRIWREPKTSSAFLSLSEEEQEVVSPTAAAAAATSASAITNQTARIDHGMTRMVEDRIYGFRRTPMGEFQYDTSLMGDGAIQFREGVRLGNPLSINADRLNYLAKKEIKHGRVEEAKELYEEAIEIDPRDGRAYLGLSRCAQRRRDFKLARKCLQAGVANAVSIRHDGTPDRGANPFLLQALGCLEEKMGDLSRAEALYIEAAKSRPFHAAAWVSLAQLRTRKLGQSARSGRACYQTAEQELKRAGLPCSAYVYTAWASLEHRKAGDTRRARQLFKSALEVDPKCSAAWQQLGVLETECQNWDEAQKCFETVLKFDQRNSRVLQAYALMEIKRPEPNSRKAIGLFERALSVNPRDAGVLQAYALYVTELGDLEAARNLLRRATTVNKRYAPVWQAWGVLETRYGDPEEARIVFQQGIWNCAQLTGSQSGGHHCRRLWQAWGVLEAQQKNYAEARRCFSRALDADSRNVPAITAWVLMEEELGNESDARAIFERTLGRFAPGSEEKMSLWRTYELMEKRLGNDAASQQVYMRAMRETMSTRDETIVVDDESPKACSTVSPTANELDNVLEKTNEVEVVRWNGGGEVWLNDRAIEARLPFNMKKRNEKWKKNP